MHITTGADCFDCRCLLFRLKAQAARTTAESAPGKSATSQAHTFTRGETSSCTVDECEASANALKSDGCEARTENKIDEWQMTTHKDTNHFMPACANTPADQEMLDTCSLDDPFASDWIQSTEDLSASQELAAVLEEAHCFSLFESRATITCCH